MRPISAAIRRGVVVLAFLVAAVLGHATAVESQAHGLLDLATCDVAITATETASELRLQPRGRLTASGRGQQLVLFHLEGTCAGTGAMPLDPSGFGASYPGEEAIAFRPAKAVGVRGQDSRGRPHEAWYQQSDPRTTVSIVVQKPGDTVGFWFAVDLPESVREVEIRIPTVLTGRVEIGPP